VFGFDMAAKAVEAKNKNSRDITQIFFITIPPVRWVKK
jgi:hypothetical protein